MNLYLISLMGFRAECDYFCHMYYYIHPAFDNIDPVIIWLDMSFPVVWKL